MVKFWYIENEFELNKLVEIKNNKDAVALFRITLWRNLKNECLYILLGYDQGHGVILTIEPIIQSNEGGGKEYANFVDLQTREVEDTRKSKEQHRKVMMIVMWRTYYLMIVLMKEMMMIISISMSMQMQMRLLLNN